MGKREELHVNRMCYAGTSLIHADFITIIKVVRAKSARIINKNSVILSEKVKWRG